MSVPNGNGENYFAAGNGVGAETLASSFADTYDDLKSLLADLRKNPWKMLWKD